MSRQVKIVSKRKYSFMLILDASDSLINKKAKDNNQILWGNGRRVRYRSVSNLTVNWQNNVCQSMIYTKRNKRKRCVREGRCQWNYIYPQNMIILSRSNHIWKSFSSLGLELFLTSSMRSMQRPSRDFFAQLEEHQSRFDLLQSHRIDKNQNFYCYVLCLRNNLWSWSAISGSLR